MKRSLTLLLALVLLLPCVLLSCKKEPDAPLTESYLPGDFFAAVKENFESKNGDFSALRDSEAPYAVRDVYGFGAGTLRYLHIPVLRTGKADEEGNLTLTVYLVSNSYDGLKTGLIDTKKIKVNAAEYGLEPSAKNVYKYIKVDVSSYEITLTEDQTLAFFAEGDTLYPAYLTENASKKTDATFDLYKKDFPRATGYFGKVGSDLLCSQGSLLFNVEFDMTDERRAAAEQKAAEEQAFAEVIEALKAKYAGKTYSVIGDSISTFEGVNNNTDYNTTIGNNNVYYNDRDNGTATRNHIFADYTDTYWGRFTKELGMELCVNNAWSGAYTYETSDTRYALNMFPRSSQLHRDNGTPADRSDDTNPDVIFVFMGTNDMLHTKGATCDADLYRDLTKMNADRSAVTAAWFEKVAAFADAQPSIEPNVAYTTFESAYALSLREMQRCYPDAEIVCLLLPQCNHSSSTFELVTRYNVLITAIAEHFGATVVKIGDALPVKQCHAYGADSTTVHPNVAGHELMFREIARTMYEKNK